MSRFDDTRKKGRGTENPLFPIPVEIKSEGRNLIRENRDSAASPVPRPFPSDDDPAALAAFLAANPAMTPRDFKGKGFGAFAPFDPHHVGPKELPWREQDRREVRALAITYPARFLTKGVRQAAARDAGLTWDEVTGRYRLVGEIDA